MGPEVGLSLSHFLLQNEGCLSIPSLDDQSTHDEPRKSPLSLYSSIPRLFGEIKPSSHYLAGLELLFS